MAISSYEKPLEHVSLPAYADYSAKQFYAMKQNSSNQAVIAGTAGETCIGILQNAPAAANRAALVMTKGVSKAILGDTVTNDQALTVNASGALIPAVLVSHKVIGRALSAGSSGEIIPVLLGDVAGKVNAGNRVVLPFYITLASITGAGDVVTALTPGFAGYIEKLTWVQDVAVSTGSKAASLNAEIGTTNTTGGVVALTSATCTPQGAVIAGTAITAANTFTATDTISIEAASVTAFVEGTGTLFVTLVDLT